MTVVGISYNCCIVDKPFLPKPPTMKMFLIVILILSSYQKASSQTDESIVSQILGDLLNCSAEIYNDTVLLEKHKGNTFFNYDSISMEKKSGLQIPQKTLSEIIINSRASKYESQWNEDQLNKMLIVISPKNDTAFLGRKPYVHCLSENQLDSVFSYSPTLSVYSISQLIFDNNQQTAIFELAYGRGGRCFSFESVLIKKIFKRWTIVKRFDWRIS